jgi:transposase
MPGWRRSLTLSHCSINSSTPSPGTGIAGRAAVIRASGNSGKRRSLGSKSCREPSSNVAAIRQYPDLVQRLDLINSVDGIGLPTAVAILVQIPEIGCITREQVAALAGLAPYDGDSGEIVGMRHIESGRKRLRIALYYAALAASLRWNPQIIALYQRLIAADKEHKRALIACARKLLIFAKTVVARGTPWMAQPIRFDQFERSRGTGLKSPRSCSASVRCFFVRRQAISSSPTCRSA